MLVKHARAKVVEVRDNLDSMPDIFGGNERLASLKAQIASFDPMVLDASRFFYPRIRAISAGEWWEQNDNGDWFGNDELTRRHGTFIHCPQYVDHNNRNAENAIGIIIASTYHPGPRPGGWVEIISAIDRERAQAYRVEHLPGQPNLLTAMKEGLVTDTSMGCFVDYSTCSVCGNRAEDVVDYCFHVAKNKGAKVTVGGVEQDVFEKNYGVTFFEDSVITSVFDQGGGGADFDAKIMSELPVTAGRRDWTHLILDRRALLADREKEMAMPKPEKKNAATVMGPDADTPARHTVGDPGSVSHDASDPDYFTTDAPDKDASLNTQSKGTSEVGGLPPLVDSPTEKESILPDQGDYPTTGAKKKVAGPEDSMGTADPGTPVGGKPPEVLEAEQEEEKAGQGLLEDIAKQDEQSAAMDERHDDEMDDAEKKESLDEAMVPGPPMSSRIRNKIAEFFGWKSRAVKEGEGVLLLDDFITEAKIDVEVLDNAIRTTRSASRRNKLISRKAVLEANVNKAISILTRASVDAKYAAKLDKMAEMQKGNPQDLIDAEGYDSDADAALLNQSQDTSSSDDAPAVGDEGKLSQDEETDDHPLADGTTSLSKRGRYKRTRAGFKDIKTGQLIRRADAEKVLDAITSFLGQGMAYAEAEDKALELYARRRSARPKPKRGRLSGTRARLAQRLIAQEDGMPDFLKDDDDDGDDDDKAEARRKRRAADEGNMDVGTGDTLESDATGALTDGDEMIQSGGEADSAGTRNPQPTEGKRPRRRRAIRGMVKILNAANGKVLGQFPLGSRNAMARIGKALSRGFGVKATNGIIEAFLMRYPNAAHKTASKHIFLSAKNRRTGETIDRTFPLSNRRAGKAAATAFRKALGMEDPDERMKGGNEDELASPSTQAVADDQNAHEGKEFGLETDGTSVPAGHEALSIRDLHAERQAKKIQTTRRENRKLKARLEAHNRAERHREATRIASIMFEKGMFAANGSIPKQKHAERREANRLSGLSSGEFAEAKRMVGVAAEGTSVPRWTRETRLPRVGSLNRPVAASTTPSNGDGDLESVEWS